jgi:uncharacterized protein DUF1761
MQHFPINFVALAVATLAKIFLGALWYSPVLFAEPWMELVNCTPEQMKAAMPKALLADVIGTFIQAFVLVHAVHYAGANSIGMGAAVGFLNWLGFIAVTTLAITIYEKKPFKLFLINNGFQLLSLLIMGAIVAVWV